MEEDAHDEQDIHKWNTCCAYRLTIWANGSARNAADCSDEACRVTGLQRKCVNKPILGHWERIKSYILPAIPLGVLCT